MIDDALAAQIAAAPDPEGVPSATLDAAAAAIAAASLLLVMTGAGMGVDSGLPDFRGPEGFWRAYPALGARGLRFEEMANPAWFEREPQLAWAFYGDRLHRYRAAAPHAGYAVLRAWCAQRPHFCFTSNVDGLLQKAGFDEAQVCEVHGSIHHLQRVDGQGEIWSADDTVVHVDPVSFRCVGPLPSCPETGRPARPNILMFNDRSWIDARTEAAEARYAAALAAQPGPRVVIELGAGVDISTVRREAERRVAGGTLIRVNPRAPEVPPGGLSIACGAAAALLAIARRLR